jgi:hypothetical protein
MATLLTIENAPVSQWLKEFPHGINYAGENVQITSAQDLVSGTVLSKVTATSKYSQVNTAGSGGNETTTGILVYPVKATGVQATLTTGTLSTNAIIWLARETGVQGNEISIALVDPAENDAALAVSVSGNAITVSLATGSGGAITSTPALIVAAIAALPAAAALVTGTASGTSAVAAVAATNLAGGVGYALSNQGIMLNKLTGCVLLLSELTYTGTAATVKTALEAMGARFAEE